MKVVLFCGGYGMRMRENVNDLPKPMQRVGPRPLLWHVMRYYAHFGHTDFILCLGYGAQHVKDYFLNYTETTSNDFVMRGGQVELLSRDIADWTITFVQTGIDSAIGERLRRVRPYLGDDEMFLANYADVLTDAPLPDMIDKFERSDAGASLLAVPPQKSFHCIELGQNTRVERFTPADQLPLWENGGYFVLRREVFDHIPQGGDLVTDGCGGLAKEGRMMSYPYRGFWQPADTIKERTALEGAYESGFRPWMVWERSGEERSPEDAAMREVFAAR